MGEIPGEMQTPAVETIMAYEQGALSDEDTVALFQRLVDTGLAWQLQGSYGRTAAAMIRAGLVTAPESARYDAMMADPFGPADPNA